MDRLRFRGKDRDWNVVAGTCLGKIMMTNGIHHSYRGDFTITEEFRCKSL